MINSAPIDRADVPSPRPRSKLPARRNQALNPSEHTSALVQALHVHADFVQGATALEVGVGSGVVLATLAGLGARKATGVDIEPEAVIASRDLAADLGFADVIEVVAGDMWMPLADRRFDLVVANLPHFPMPGDAVPGRLPSWSAGGFDGRRLLDPFLKGLGRRLADGGMAIITHNAFVDLQRTSAILAQDNLEVAEHAQFMVFIPPEKLARMTEETLAAANGRTIHRYGPYAFGQVKILKIAQCLDDRG